MEELLARIRSRLAEVSESILLDDGSHASITPDKYIDLPSDFPSKKISFVDGGDLEIIRSPALSVFFNRVYTTTYLNNRKIASNRNEFYSVIIASVKNSRVRYMADYVFSDGFRMDNIDIDARDGSIATNGKRADISAVGNQVRRFAELAAASRIQEGYIVLDGSLDPTYPGEKEQVLSLTGSGRVFAIAKTNSLLTSNGLSAISQVIRQAKNDTWVFSISEKSALVKLHKNSDYVFKLDFSCYDEDLVSLLARNSTDPIFLGYPYGLVEADRNARVSRQERENLLLQLKLRLKKDLKEILPYLNSSNAHDVLDNIT